MLPPSGPREISLADSGVTLSRRIWMIIRLEADALRPLRLRAVTAASTLSRFAVAVSSPVLREVTPKIAAGRGKWISRRFDQARFEYGFPASVEPVEGCPCSRGVERAEPRAALQKPAQELAGSPLLTGSQ